MHVKRQATGSLKQKVPSQASVRIRNVITANSPEQGSHPQCRFLAGTIAIEGRIRVSRVSNHGHDYERASSPQTQREYKQTIEETGFANILRNRSQDRLSELQAIDQTERVENQLLRERSSGLTCTCYLEEQRDDQLNPRPRPRRDERDKQSTCRRTCGFSSCPS